MNLRDISQAIGARDTLTVRRAFRALISYPDPERVEATSAGFLVVALNKVCAALDSDNGIMGAETCEAFGLPNGSSYAGGTNQVRKERTRISQYLIERFAA